MLESLASAKVPWAIGLVVLALLIRFFQRLHFHRSLVKGLPGPPHSYLFGSLPAMAKVVMKQPSDAAPHGIMHFVKDHYDLDDYFYIDPWPLGPPVMPLFDLDLINQVTTRSPQLPKHPVTEDFMKNFGGPGNLVSSEGSEWKKWRSAFNPGFSTAYLMTTMPMLVKECQTFCSQMEENARQNKVFRMEPATTKLTVQIIGRIVLDLDLEAWSGRNPLLEAFNSQVRWQALGAQFQPSELVDIRRPFVQAFNNWKMDRYISKMIDKRFSSRQDRGKAKHVVDLAFEAYLADKKSTTGQKSSVNGLDREFKRACISNMKAFIFAGHDTTSSTIAYSLYFLFKYPEFLARIRKEHDDVFGPDPDAVAEKLREDPFLVNKLEFTLNVSKEVLRLEPPGSSIRTAEPGFTLHDTRTGTDLPTDNFMLWAAAICLGRSEKYWKDPNTFNPDHFHPSQAHCNNISAWIPFSKGNRNCIGQELALLEIRVILAMVVRKFDFVAAYDELDKLKGEGSGYPSKTDGILEQFGERAYQIQRGTAKPCEGMPCRIMLRT